MGLSFLSPKPVQHVVGKTEDGADETLNFYPISLGMAFKLRSIAGPLVRGLTTLFARHDTDTTKRSRSTRNGDSLETEGMDLAITPELAKVRHEQRQAAVNDIVVALTDKANVDVVCEVIMDSLREQYPRPLDSKKVSDFRDSTPLPAITTLLFGVAKANKDLFGPFADLVPKKMREIGSRLRPGVEEEKDESSAPAQVAAPTEAAVAA